MIYTDAREEEIAQLSPHDVITKNSHPYLRIHDEGNNKLKNASSLRTAPIHNKLIDGAFPTFVESRRGNPQLFMTLKAEGRNRLYSRVQRRTTAGIRNQVMIKDKRAVPHSLPHTFKDALPLVQAPEELTERLMGHTTSGRAVPCTYGNPDQLIELTEWLNKADPTNPRRTAPLFALDFSPFNYWAASAASVANALFPRLGKRRHTWDRLSARGRDRKKARCSSGIGALRRVRLWSLWSF
jgi:hypothetical protein